MARAAVPEGVALKGEGSYRPDLDGMRGIAVASVVAYHLGLPVARGGFVGVDVFFVLSGYLITRLIATDLEAGRFSIIGFYERRMRRILPALIFVCAVCTVAAFGILLPDELEQFSRSLVATGLSISNFWCLKNSSYFSPAAELQPLFHTWSLAVEEQFYLLFPLALGIAFKAPERTRSLLVWGTFGLSLLASILLLRRHPDSTFFLLHTRAWELLAGSVLALKLVPAASSSGARTLGGAGGLLAIGFAIIVFDRDTPFPGAAALVPCLGAALVIWSGEGDNRVARVLSNRPLVFLGLISYSLYLWHWPLIVFAKLLTVAPLGGGEQLGLAFASVGLAALTWRFVERPFRVRGVDGFSRGAIFVSAGSGLAALAAAGFSILALGGVPQRFGPDALALAAASGDASPLRAKCHFGRPGRSTFADTCILGSSATAQVIVYGDSHGAELSAALGSLAAARGASVREITASACPPSAGFVIKGRSGCVRYNAAMLESLAANAPSTIIIAANSYAWTHHRPEDYWQGLKVSLDALARAGHRLIVYGAVPPLPNEIPAPAALARWTAHGHDPGAFRFPPPARFPEVDARLKEIAEGAGATYIPVAPVYCSANACKAYLDGSVLYWDGGHLTLSGAKLLAGKLLVPILWPGKLQSAAAER